MKMFSKRQYSVALVTVVVWVTSI